MTVDCQPAMDAARDDVALKTMLFDEPSSAYHLDEIEGRASTTTTWRAILGYVRASTVIVAEDDSVDVWRVAKFAEHGQEEWSSIIQRRVELDDEVGPNPLGDCIHAVFHVTRLFHGPMTVKVDTLERSLVTCNELSNDESSPLAKYEIESPATASKCKYMRPADIRVWDLLRKYVKTKEDERLAKKKERLAKKDERLAKKDERLDKTDERLALLGSPGCGKSSMHVSGGYTKFHLFTPKSCVSGVLLNFDLPRLVQLLAVIDGRTLNPFIIVDGFTDTSLKLLWHYDLVVTSGPFNDSRMGSNLLLLPSWSLEDVVQLAFQANMLSEEEIKKRYAHFGGDLRSIFNADQKAADRALYAGLDRVSDENVSLLLSGSGRCSKNQVDRVRRFRVENPLVDEHFQNPSHWIGVVESSTVQRALLNKLPLEWFDKLLRHAVGTTLHGNAYEMSINARAEHKQELRFDWLLLQNNMIDPRRGEP